MHAPTAAIRDLPAATSRSKKPPRSGLKRIAVSAGRYSTLRGRALPALDSRAIACVSNSSIAWSSLASNSSNSFLACRSVRA
jgi:hypothetical protein